MTFTPEEALAFHEKSMMIQRLPLEQAVQYVIGPVYGLDDAQFGLHHRCHFWCGENSMRLAYLYSSVESYHDQYPRAFTVTTTVTTSLYAEGVRPCGIPFMGYLRHGMDSWFCCDISLCQRFKGKDAVFIIDGKSFKGCITHRADPMLYSRVTLQHERVVIDAEALGPSIEEFIQILESLHDLKGKAVE
jgi:hypothetical protein